MVTHNKVVRVSQLSNSISSPEYHSFKGHTHLATFVQSALAA